ncbi:MAG TPA: class I SAM-dependent methyltransferase [Burkholderiales bacterium]|jgi:predicted O-methyltransferase YrrM|nr:class I SAM-dependent methyltransferase [Burkholderiales bacterium]
MARGPAELPKKFAAYVERIGLRETAVQRRLRAVTRKLPRGSMQIGPDQAAFMQVLVRAIGARRCLEVGTFTGYSALAVALALPPGGRMVCCDVSEEWTSIARRYWKQARIQNKITLHLAPALQTLKTLKGPFDFAFIDADKANLQAYFERCLRLVRRGGLVAIDNTLWHGRVLDRSDRTADTRAVRAFNRRLRDDRRVEIALVPIGDGLTLAWKR